MPYLSRSAISADAMLGQVAAPERGGACVFLGTVRSGPADPGGGVRAIEYAAYEEMADAECRRIVAEARERWPDARVALQHRIGTVATGEASVAVVAAAPHRAEAFAACRYVIEEIKRRLPIWKKELRADGSARWVDPSGHPAASAPAWVDVSSQVSD